MEIIFYQKIKLFSLTPDFSCKAVKQAILSFSVNFDSLVRNNSFEKGLPPTAFRINFSIIPSEQFTL